jgi:hypothetical protein
MLVPIKYFVGVFVFLRISINMINMSSLMKEIVDSKTLMIYSISEDK